MATQIDPTTGYRTGSLKIVTVVTPAHLFAFTAVFQAVSGKGTHRIEHSVDSSVARGFRCHQRLLNQGRQLGLGASISRPFAANADDGIEPHGPSENAEPSEKTLFALGQQQITPVEGCLQFGLSRWKACALGLQELETMLQPSQDFGFIHRAELCSGELDGKRKPVQPAAHLGKHWRVRNQCPISRTREFELDLRRAVLTRYPVRPRVMQAHPE